jgi:endo-1,4-beta-xylanase
METYSNSVYRHRLGTATLQLVGTDGTPLQNTEVVVKQTRHAFLFGSAQFTAVPYANGELAGEAREKAEFSFQKFFDLFNYATLPFYWGRFEPTQGQPDTRRLKQAAQWLVANGCVLKGHPLCWHTVTAPWLLDLSNAEIQSAQLERIRREITNFAGLIDMWDVINEVVIMPIFDKYDNGITRICKDLGRIRLVREVFAAARESNPDAVLLINDFDTSASYDILIEGLLESGIPIDAIGIQAHMHQGYWGVEKTQEILDRFSRFKLPLHFTENTLVSGHLMPPEIEDLNDYQVPEWPSTPDGEERQAREAVLHYKTLFAHPMVASITWWDFVDGQWLGAPAGLITKENRVKPVYDELYNLIKGEWWGAPAHFRTDEHGTITISGFRGEYTIHYDGKESSFTVMDPIV